MRDWVFGTGAADEPLPDRGLTHLCEHLALSDLGRRDHAFNGFVTWRSTHFVASGTDTQVATFFNDVVDRLKAVPTGRLDTERSILRAESMGRQGSIVEALLGHRFGARSLGRASYLELALTEATADRIRGWADETFWSCPMAMWVLSENPRSVVDQLLFKLPSRPPRAPLDLVEVLATPASIVDNVVGPNLSMLMPRSTSSVAALTLLRDRFEDRIRTEHGDAYTVAGSYEPIGPSLAHAQIGADALPDRRHRAVLSSYELVRDFQAGGPTAAEVDRYRTLAEAAWTPEARPGWAVTAAHDHALGRQFDAEHVRSELDALTPEGVRQAFTDALGSALFLVPHDAKPDSAYPPVRRWPSPALGGTGFTPVKGFDQSEQIRVTGDACSWSSGSTQRVTITRADHEALLCWDDGSRTVVGGDGSHLNIRPWNWQRGKRLVELVDEAFGPHRRVQMGAGEGPPKKRARRRGLALGRGGAVAVAVGLGTVVSLSVVAGMSAGDRSSSNGFDAQEMVDRLDLTPVLTDGQIAEALLENPNGQASALVGGPLVDAICAARSLAPRQQRCSALALDGTRYEFDVVFTDTGTTVALADD